MRGLGTALGGRSSYSGLRVSIANAVFLAYPNGSMRWPGIASYR